MNKKYKFIADKKITVTPQFLLEELHSRSHFLNRWFKNDLSDKLRIQLTDYIRQDIPNYPIALNQFIENEIAKFKQRLIKQGKHKRLKKLESKKIPYRLIPEPELKEEVSENVGIGNTGLGFSSTSIQRVEDDVYESIPEEPESYGPTGTRHDWWNDKSNMFQRRRR